MLSSLLSELDVPSSARLVGIQRSRGRDGADEWTVTFRALPPTPPPSLEGAREIEENLSSSLPPLPALSRDSHASFQCSAAAPARGGMPPHPPVLSDQQIKGLAAHAPLASPASLSAAQSWATVGENGALPLAAAPVDGLAEGVERQVNLSPVPAAFPALPFRSGSANRLFPLRCSVQTYDWGKFGADSLVAKLAANNDTDLHVDPKSPYAELWMGTHPSGPSMVMLDSPWRIITPLYDWLKLNPSMRALPATATAARAEPVGTPPASSTSGHGLPFLLKVLSVRTALSIQAHPNKKLAEQLHNNDPEHYKDDNHKPEMTIAVTPFEALCSFQKINSVLENLRACPELVAIVGEDSVSMLSAAAEKAAPLTPAWPVRPWGRRGAIGKPGTPRPEPELPDGLTMKEARAARSAHVVPALQRVFRRLMTADSNIVTTQLDMLMHRIRSTSPMLLSPIDELAHRLHDQYPKDTGVFCVYLLNYLVLEPGEALFCNANEPHAYLFGDCVECMATSDNVVRAGLTGKFKDVDVLCDMLTYDDGPPFLVAPSVLADGVLRYITPVPEFLVDRAEVVGPCSTLLPPSPFVSLLLVIDGRGTLEELHPSASITNLHSTHGSHNDGADTKGGGGVRGTEGGAGAGLVHELRSGYVFMACAGTAVRLRVPRGERLLVFRATEKHEL